MHEGLDLEVRKGEVLGLVGGSGAGKSVLLNTLIGLREPQGGKVEVLGVDPYRASDRDLRGLESRWGVLFQNGALFSALSVRENVSAPMQEHTRMPKSAIADLADLKLMLAGLQPRVGDLRPAELSGGMRKRAGAGAGHRAGSGTLVPRRTDGGAGPDLGGGVRRPDPQPFRRLGLDRIHDHS